MIGKITFDKSSKDIQLFLYSIYLIGKHGNNCKIRRNFAKPCFVEIMATFTNSKAYKLSKGNYIEERTVYNKSLYAQYYGFIERETDENSKEWLLLTERGKILFNIIECDETEKTCFIPIEKRKIFQILIWNSILFDSFGRMNDGAQTSKTEIDAPKVIFRTIFDLGYVTNEEFFYFLYSLNKGDEGILAINKSYSDLLKEIKENRNYNKYDYSAFFNQNGLGNKVSDSKIIDLLSDPEVDILCKKDVDGGIGNFISDSCESFKDDSSLLCCYYRPHFIIAYSPNEVTAKTYFKQTLLNKQVEQKETVIIDARTIEGQKEFDSVYISAISKANNANTVRQFFIVICNDENHLSDLFGDKINLLERIDDYTNEKYGYSKNYYELENGNKLRIPYNFNFIAIIINNK